MEPGKSIQQLNIGDAVVMTKKIVDEDIRLFAKVSGDENPIHLDEEYAATTRFKRRIAHGHYVASMFSTLLGTKLPGQGSIYLSQSIKYMAPVYLDDVITAEVKVIEKIDEKNRVTLETTAYNQDGTVVVKGVAEIMPPKEQSNVK